MFPNLPVVNAQSSGSSPLKKGVEIADQAPHPQETIIEACKYDTDSLGAVWFREEMGNCRA